MIDCITYLRRIARQTLVLAGLAGLTFLAGMEWAEAATRDAGTHVPGGLHVLVLFLVTIGFLVHAVAQSQKPARARARRRNRR